MDDLGQRLRTQLARLFPLEANDPSPIVEIVQMLLIQATGYMPIRSNRRSDQRNRDGRTPPNNQGAPRLTEGECCTDRLLLREKEKWSGDVSLPQRNQSIPRADLLCVRKESVHKPMLVLSLIHI